MSSFSQKNYDSKLVIPKFAQDVIAGTIGGWAQVIVGQPLDTIKVRLQTQPSPPIYRNATDCFQQLFRQEGVNYNIVSLFFSAPWITNFTHRLEDFTVE